MEQAFADLSEVERHFENPLVVATSSSAIATSPAVVASSAGVTSSDIDAVHACERGTDEAMTFVRSYCYRHGLPDNTGRSDIERVCEAIANDARDEFKTMRNANQFIDHSPSTTTLENDLNSSKLPLFQKSNSSKHCSTTHSSTTVDTEAEIKRLQQSRKYKKRLRNNRRSAHAAKVYKEVLRRAFSHHLANLTEKEKPDSGTSGLVKTEQDATTTTTNAKAQVVQDTNVPLHVFRAVQQENMHLKMLLFQHGILYQPILTPAISYSHGQQLLNIIPGLNSGVFNETTASVPLPNNTEVFPNLSKVANRDSESC